MTTKKSNPVQAVQPYLLFNGQCDVAFKFYEQFLSGPPALGCLPINSEFRG
jgi:hypothetical protein